MYQESQKRRSYIIYILFFFLSGSLVLIDFFSKYSENFNTTSPPLNSVLPDSGFEEINFGGVLSSGPPLGGAIAAHV